MIHNYSNKSPTNCIFSEDMSPQNIEEIFAEKSGRFTAVNSKEELIGRIEKFISKIELAQNCEFSCLFPLNPECSIKIQVGAYFNENDAPHVKETCIFLKNIEKRDPSFWGGYFLEKRGQFGLLRLAELSHEGIMKVDDEIDENAIKELFCLNDKDMEYFANLPPLLQSENMLIKSEVTEIEKKLSAKVKSLSENMDPITFFKIASSFNWSMRDSWFNSFYNCLD